MGHAVKFVFRTVTRDLLGMARLKFRRTDEVGGI